MVKSLLIACFASMSIVIGTWVEPGHFTHREHIYSLQEGEDPDSLWRIGIPYYDFRNYFDSCLVHCRFGEVRIVRADGSVEGVNPNYFHFSGGPVGFSSYEGMQDSSRTKYFTVGAGDEIRYYKDLSLITKYTSTEYFGLADTLFFITQLIDSASGACVAVIDTAGVIVADSLSNCQFYYNSSGWPPQNNLWSYHIPSDFQTAKRFLSMRVQFHASHDSLDVLCRWDELSSVYHSRLDE